METWTSDAVTIWLGDFFTWWAAVFTWDFGRYLVGAGGTFLIVWVLFKKQLSGRKIRTKTPRRRQMLREFRASVMTAAVFGLIGLITKAGVDAGFIEFYGSITDKGWAYFWFSLVVLIVAHDAYFYWTHRLLHLPKVIKKTHWLHHRSINPTPWTAYSFDPIEAAVQALFVPIILLFLPMHGTAMFLFLAHMIIRNAVGHSGYELFPRRWAVRPIFGAITMVTHHDMHHSNGNSNFGLYFTWWDRLMGTEHPDYLARATGNPDAKRRPLGLRGAAGIAGALVLMAGLVFTAAPAGADDATKNYGADIKGYWVSETGDQVVEIGACKEGSRRICGDLVWADGADVKEPTQLLRGFRQARSHWSKGKFIDPESGKKREGRLQLLADGTLKVSRCKRSLCRHDVWQRPDRTMAQLSAFVKKEGGR